MPPILQPFSHQAPDLAWASKEQMLSVKQAVACNMLCWHSMVYTTSTLITTTHADDEPSHQYNHAAAATIKKPHSSSCLTLSHRPCPLATQVAFR